MNEDKDLEYYSQTYNSDHHSGDHGNMVAFREWELEHCECGDAACYCDDLFQDSLSSGESLI